MFEYVLLILIALVICAIAWSQIDTHLMNRRRTAPRYTGRRRTTVTAQTFRPTRYEGRRRG